MIPGERFSLQEEKKEYACEHVLEVGKIFPDDVPEDVKEE